MNTIRAERVSCCPICRAAAGMATQRRNKDTERVLVDE